MLAETCAAYYFVVLDFELSPVGTAITFLVVYNSTSSTVLCFSWHVIQICLAFHRCYKDLMAKCNGLGSSLRKLEKKKRKITKLKVN